MTIRSIEIRRHEVSAKRRLDEMTFRENYVASLFLHNMNLLTGKTIDYSNNIVNSHVAECWYHIHRNTLYIHLHFNKADDVNLSRKYSVSHTHRINKFQQISLLLSFLYISWDCITYVVGSRESTWEPSIENFTEIAHIYKWDSSSLR